MHVQTNTNDLDRNAQAALAGLAHDIEALAKSRPIVDYRADNLTATELRHFMAVRTAVRKLAVHDFDPTKAPAAWAQIALLLHPLMHVKNNVLRTFAAVVATFLIDRIDTHKKASEDARSEARTTGSKLVKLLPVATRESLVWPLIRAELSKSKSKSEVLREVEKVTAVVDAIEVGQTLARTLAQVQNEQGFEPRDSSNENDRGVFGRGSRIKHEHRASAKNVVDILNMLSEQPEADVDRTVEVIVPVSATTAPPYTVKSRAERKREERAARKAAGRKDFALAS